MTFYMTLIAGIGCILIPLWNFQKVNHLKRHGTELSATVCKIKEIHGRSKSGTYITYRPVLQYNHNGIEYIHDANIAKNQPHYYVGQSVKIYCDPENPKDAVLAETTDAKGYIMFPIIGVVMILVALIIKFA